MKTYTFDVISKNRVWIDAVLNGYKCKIKLDEKSKDLPLGKQELTVNDISVRSKYGTSLRYELVSAFDSSDTIFLSCDYNALLVERCRNLGGVWDSESKVWVFNSGLAQEVEKLELIFGSEKKMVTINFLKSVEFYHKKASFFGIALGQAFGRDTGAKVFEGVAVVEGAIKSGGSIKNWCTRVSKSSVIKLLMPVGLVDACINGEIQVEEEIKYALDEKHIEIQIDTGREPCPENYDY